MRASIVLLAATVLWGPGLAAESPFEVKPSAARSADQVVITFQLKAPGDVEVAVLGPDGEVVRHLAALQPGLSQSLTWDHLADWGRPAGDGPFRVRVRTGMGVRFGRTIGENPCNFNETVSRGLAVDPDNGDVYLLARKTRDSSLYFLRVYNRDGEYLRQLMPYRADLDAASRDAFGKLDLPWSDRPAPMNYCSLWPFFYPVKPGEDGRRGLAYKLMAVRGGDGAVVLLNEAFTSIYRVRKSDGGAVGASFAEGLWPKGKRLAGSSAVGPVMGAFAPDGRTVYFAGYAAGAPRGKKPNPDWPNGRIYKMVRTDAGPRMSTFADVPLPADAKPPQNSWDVTGNTQALHGVAVDKAGRVFVCDAPGGKVWVYTPDGKIAGSVAVADAYMVSVNDATGALYVLTRRSTPGTARDPVAKSLVKLDGWGKDAKVVEALAFPPRGGACDVFLAGDFTGPVPRLWVTGCPRAGSLTRIDDTDGKLTVVEDLADRGTLAPGFAVRMDVDPQADLVYIHNGWGDILRYNGLTGEYAGELDRSGRPRPLVGSEFCIRRDGMIYLSGSTYAGGGYFGNQGACVTPDGTLYFNGMFTFRANAVFQVAPDGTPGAASRLREAFASEQISPHCRKGGFKGCLVGWLQDQSGGVEVDPQGNIYVGVRILPRGYELPEAFTRSAGGGRPLAQAVGSIIKFGPDGGGMVPDNLKTGDAYRVSKNWTFDFHVPEKLGRGLRMAAGQRLDWYKPPWTILMEGAVKAYPMLAPFSYTCACQTPRFDVDDYGRLYIPNALGCTVLIVDNAGNEITRFGHYGNTDDQRAAGPGEEPIPLAYPVAAKASFDHIYVADSANRQVVRADPTYQPEAVCAVRDAR